MNFRRLTPLISILFAYSAWGSASRTIDADAITASDHSTTISFSSQAQNIVLATPNGSSGKPTFRALVSADLPAGLVSPIMSVSNWVEGANSPLPVIENGMRTFSWTAGAAQSLTTAVTVPFNYGSGSQIFLRIKFLSSGFASGNDLMTTVGTLVRSGTDAITSTTNQRTSTNTAVTPAGSNIPYVVAFDLTDATGKINGVSVSAGDTILVNLTRGSDTDVADIHGLVVYAEARFQ